MLIWTCPKYGENGNCVTQYERTLMQAGWHNCNTIQLDRENHLGSSAIEVLENISCRAAEMLPFISSIAEGISKMTKFPYVGVSLQDENNIG